MHADLVVAELTPQTQQAYLRAMLQLIHMMQTAPAAAAVLQMKENALRSVHWRDADVENVR